ncbi:retinitis pigmentosa 1-like 1 protein [Phyllopteryx taeniolatus]|uniref:retinitis pigmentosa 1-like 1 protein n=1 Tax=Phyllopteryx taeniolatus TaxID=161469 RepID=UPI002AD53168|nr:retinitis pigmentosa 1-like 1 protein [Phyllopteryx taeniolatus]XP_061653568.1 retinitis pigmentosa 1-like 1 protein [Phyllopteryx taeniolatus]XP_061653575.1 retinitis pigmentosa 1-like 1 protein [Phyllopteryx taeniolatus]
MQSVQEGRWEPQRASKDASTPRPRPPSNSRLAHVETTTPAKRITFYRSGDSQFGGVRMAIHKRSFKCFDALLDDLSQKVPLPFGVRTVTTPRGTHIIKHLEELQDGGCYLCSDRRQPKPVNMLHASKRQSIWHHHSRIPPQPETLSTSSSGHLPHRHRQILLIKNTDPGMRRNVVLSRRSIRSMRAFLEEVSEVMQFHVRKIYTADGRKVDSVQSLMTCPGVLVCVGREALSPLLLKFLSKSSEEKLPVLSSRSPGLGPRTPGNGARSPGIQEARSSPYGAQSRASEFSEGQESKKSVNFGLETKKSIIHPRSDSSTRSTRFSLSSEKSFGNGVRAHLEQRPPILNDDIEKRVLVNKDGSLSVEMKVRFRLRNDETLQWSTQIGKSPSLTSDCCPPTHPHHPYLQNDQSESCSDCATFDRDYMNYSNQSLHHALDVSQCPCCYQMQGQQYNLWENPIKSHKHPPIPPPYISSHTHTTIRQSHSSCSSSSCNSMRVVRCQAKFSNCGRVSDSEQSQFVQEETCVMEQVERSVAMGPNEDTNEVCMRSRCSSRSEVVTLDGNVRSLSERSVVDEPMEEEVDHPLSRVTSSSHVLQSFKEDQDVDDDLPPRASECSHRTKSSLNGHLNANRPVSHSTELDKPEDQDDKGSGTASPVTSCLCGAATPHIASEAAELDQTHRFSSNVSRASYRATKVVNQTNESEQIQSIVEALSGTTGQSGMSSVCPNCGGYKWVVTSNSSSRVSQKSCRTPQAPSNLTSSLENQENDNYCTNDDALSTQSNKTNLTAHGSVIQDVLESKASSAISRMSSPELTKKEQERATTAITHKSNTSQKSVSTGATTENKMERSSSAVSGQSNKSNFSGTVKRSHITTTEEAEGGTCDKREAKPCISPKTVSGIRMNSPADNTALENTNSRSHSCLSGNSNASIKSGKEDRPNSVLSTESSKSNISGKSKISCHKSTNSQCAIDEPKVVQPNEKEETDMCLENQKIGDNKPDCNTAEERATSALSANSTTSCQTTCTAGSPNLKEANVSSIEGNGNKSNDAKEQVVSAISMKSNSSLGSCASQKSVSTKHLKSASQRPNVVTIKTPERVDKVSEATETTQKNGNDSVVGEEVEERNAQSKTSGHAYGQMLSPTGISSSQAHFQKARAASPSISSEVSGQSAFSVHSVTSSKSGSYKCQCVVALTLEEGKKKRVGEENEAKKDGDKMELNDIEGSRGTEQLSQNSSGSISLGLPDDHEMCDADSCKSCMSLRNDNHNKDRLRTATPNVQSILSHQSKVEESPKAGDVPTIEAPGSDGDVDNHPKNYIFASPASSCNIKRINNRTSSSLSSASANVKNSKLSQQSDGDVKNVDPDNNGSKKSASRAEEKQNSLINKAAGGHSSGLCSLTSDLAADAKVNGLKEDGIVKATDSGSVQSGKTSSSSKKVMSVRSSRQGNSRRCSKETCGESTMSATDILMDTKAMRQHCHQSRKASKASNEQHVEKIRRHQIKWNQKDQGEGTEVTPACLPNASPSEVVSDWLRSIPSNSNIIALDELTEDGPGKELMAKVEADVTESNEEHTQTDKLDKTENVGDDKKEEECAAIDEGKNPDLTAGIGAIEASPQPSSPFISGKALPKNWRSSAAVMKVLLSSSLGRCRSLPEVSPVYGRRLSTSAKGLLDCLAQLQLIEPVGGQGCNKNEDRSRQYGDIIAILQSLWITEPKDIETKDTGTEQGTPPRSSSGVGMSSGSGGSGKDHDHQGGDETLPKVSSHEDEAVEKGLGDGIEPQTLEIKEVFLKEQPYHSEEQIQVPPILESPKEGNPSSSDKSSANNSSNFSSTTPPTVLKASFSNKPSQDPDPVWVLHLLEKLEKEFMNHYLDAMAEFKVRWDLDDSLILDTMISELKDEVNHRIQSSIKREMSKIQSRSGRGGKSPRPPKGANLSRESTMTEKRRRMLKVMKNQSVKTADSFSDGEMTAEFSDQRSDDDYCPCDACVRKKMAVRPLKMNPAAVDAPVMMEFDLLKILQLKKTPAAVPSSVSQPKDKCDDSVVIEEEVRSLEVVQEEEEDEESSEDFKTSLEETIPEDDDEDADEEVKCEGDEGEDEEVTGGREAGHSQISGEKLCTREETPEEADKTSDNMGGKGEKETEDEAETAEEGVGTVYNEEDSEGDKVDGVATEEEEQKVTQDSTNQDLEESTLLEEKENTSASAGAENEDEQEEEENDGSGESQEEGESSQQERASQKRHSSNWDVFVTEGEKADAEDSSTDAKHPSDNSPDESEYKTHGGEDVDGSTTADGALLHQFTRISVESQQGSLED